MAHFEYTGVDASGKSVKGALEAHDEGELRMTLRSQGIRPTAMFQSAGLTAQIATKAAPGFDFSFGKGPKMKMSELIAWTRQLQVLMGAGVPLVQSLEILTEQQALPANRDMMKAITDRVSAGAFFWESLAGYPKIFPRLFVSLVKAGESSGALDTLLKRLVRYLEDSDRLAKMVRGAMIYPVSVLSIGVGVVAVLLVFVIPKFEELLKSNGEALPLPTQIVINASHFLGNNFVWLIFGIGLIGFGLRQYFQSPEGRSIKDKTLESLPLIGSILRQAAVARFCRTLATLLTSGITLLDAMEVCKQTLDHSGLEDAISKARAAVEAGKPFGATIAGVPLFPRMASQMISVGETTGSLDKMLEKVADFYENEVEGKVAGVSKLIEPLILVFLGGTVGTIMVAMYLPIFKLAAGGAN